mmetsp:Transcript_56626/g.64650  ORF Transcript_56626/g.64650 Transcript_56626/m.64650 type:complete len:126 (-) Transcript_56626:187-564(-)
MAQPNVRFLLPKFDGVSISAHYKPETTTVLDVKMDLITNHIPDKVHLSIKIGALRLFSHGMELKDEELLSTYDIKDAPDFPTSIQTMIRFQTKSFLEEMNVKNQTAKKQNSDLNQKPDTCSCTIF